MFVSFRRFQRETIFRRPAVRDDNEPRKLAQLRAFKRLDSRGAQLCANIAHASLNSDG